MCGVGVNGCIDDVEGQVEMDRGMHVDRKTARDPSAADSASAVSHRCANKLTGVHVSIKRAAQLDHEIFRSD